MRAAPPDRGREELARLLLYVPQEVDVMLRFLVADDDDLTREVVCRALRGPNVAIREASSGAELIQLLAEEGPFDLVVTDLAMPWLSGLQALLAARHAPLEVPFVMITALADPTLSRRVEALGRARLLRKPIDLSELRSCVGTLLMESRRAM